MTYPDTKTNPQFGCEAGVVAPLIQRLCHPSLPHVRFMYEDCHSRPFHRRTRPSHPRVGDGDATRSQVSSGGGALGALGVVRASYEQLGNLCVCVTQGVNMPERTSLMLTADQNERRTKPELRKASGNQLAGGGRWFRQRSRIGWCSSSGHRQYRPWWVLACRTADYNTFFVVHMECMCRLNYFLASPRRRKYRPPLR